MLVSIVLTLLAERIGKPAAHLGRANYSESLQWLDRIEPGIDREIHDLPGLKPLTCSTLFGKYDQRNGLTYVRQGEVYWMRLSGLTERVSQTILAGFWDEAHRPQSWSLNQNHFRILNAYCHPNQHPWSGATSYQQLAERHLLGISSNARMNEVTLEFASPTAFKKNEMQMPLPLPSLVFGSLLDRWNAFSMVALSEQVRNFGELAVEINHFDLRSVAVAQKNEGLRVGAVGTARYRAHYQDPYWLALFQLLADFALFSGVGVQTTVGMGMVRRK